MIILSVVAIAAVIVVGGTRVVSEGYLRLPSSWTSTASRARVETHRAHRQCELFELKVEMRARAAQVRRELERQFRAIDRR